MQRRRVNLIVINVFFLLIFSLVFSGGQAIAATEGSSNNFFGTGAGDVTTGSSNSFFGRSAGYENTSGYTNCAFGQCGLQTPLFYSNPFQKK